MNFESGLKLELHFWNKGTMRKKWGEPKKKFGAPFGVAIGVVAR